MKRKISPEGGLERDFQSPPPRAGVGRPALLVQIKGPQPLAGEQDTGVLVRGYDLNPVTLGPGLHGLRWHPPGATTDFVAIGSAWNRVVEPVNENETAGSRV